MTSTRKLVPLPCMPQRIALACCLPAAALTQPAADTPKPPPPAPAPAVTPAAPMKPFAQEVPVAAYKIDMLPIPPSADGKVKPFYMSKTELGWEAFDVYIYRLDEEAGKGPRHADAITRPTKPYLPPDRGFGHEGFAAISMAHKNAAEFCKWLSAHTGRAFRLPTEAEWEHAARAGAPAEKPLGNLVPDGAKVTDCAWVDENADGAPHPVGKKQPNAWGLHDMLGNAAEWVTGADGKPVTKGGSYRDRADKLSIAARTPPAPAWNASDPQVPKSKWWLSDGPHIGFRIVCEVDAPAPQTTAPPDTKPAPDKKP